jgi:heme-degrading monooxygenase HmoA
VPADRTPAPRAAQLPEPPYYAVVFTSLRTEGDHGYGETADRMAELVREVPGFLGADSVRQGDGLGITVAYFTDEEAILTWRRNAEHAAARAMGRSTWYDHYAVHIARVERAYRSPLSTLPSVESTPER